MLGVHRIPSTQKAEGGVEKNVSFKNKGIVMSKYSAVAMECSRT
jgi:hypothetical protein